MQGNLEQQLAAIARQYTDGGPVEIEIPLLRIQGKVHPCGVFFQLDGSPVPEPLTAAEKRRLVQVAQRIRQNGNLLLEESELLLFTRAGYHLRHHNLMSVVEAIVKQEEKS